MNRGITRLLASAVTIVLVCATAGAEDQKQLRAEVQDSFKQFAAAVKDDKYEEAAKWIAAPADKVWTNFAAFRSAAAKYQKALEDNFGKGKQLPGPLLMFARKGDLAEHLYEAVGEIQDVKSAEINQVHVRVWTKRPDLQDRTETALYERSFTAVKVGDKWKFQLHTFGGTPVVKKVKRKTAEGKEVEVYAEHYPKTPRRETWEELKPISYEGREESLRQEAELWSKWTDILKVQREQVEKKGVYKTRKEAIDALDEQMRKAFEAMRKERSRR